MEESLKWLIVNADRISAFALLLLLVVALLKQWLVLGWTHQECVRDRDGFKTRVDALAKSNEEKILRLELEVESLRSEHREHRARKTT